MGVLSLPDTQSSDPQPWRILELKAPEHVMWSEQSPQPLPNPSGEFRAEWRSGLSGVMWTGQSGTSRESALGPAQMMLGPISLPQGLLFLPGVGIFACPEVLPAPAFTVIVTRVCIMPQIPET